MLQAALGRTWGRAGAAICLAGCAIFTLIGVDTAGRITLEDAGIELALRAIAGLLAGLMVLGQIALWWWLLRENRLAWRRSCLITLVVVQALGVLIAERRFEGAFVNKTTSASIETPVGLKASLDEALLTDRGRLVTVYRVSQASREASADEIRRQYDSLANVSTGSLHCNCHGWVFTQGRYIIDSDGAETILADNGYFIVEKPQVGDVIVYRDQDRRIVHTGLVRAVDQGAVWIESKWGVGRRFVHHPADQAYSEQFVYYRTERNPQWLELRSRHLVKVRNDPAKIVGRLATGAALVGSSESVRAEPLEPLPAWSDDDLPISAE